MTTPDLLRAGFRWTTDRAAALDPTALGAPTPCGAWTLQDLLVHASETLGAFADAADAPPAGDTTSQSEAQAWSDAFAALGERSVTGWAMPGALERTYELPFGTMPGEVALSANLLEAVVHGWDIGRATGERAEIPDELAGPILAFARVAIGEEQRGAAFGAVITPSSTSASSPGAALVAFLGRDPS